MIGVVVPAYNREDNLRLLLASLERQSDDNFHLILADDGATDGTAALIASMREQPSWRGRLTRVSCGPHQGVRTGRARNIGAANLPGNTSLLLMLDTDLVLQPEAVASFARAHSENPGCVLYGAVEWLAPMDRCEILGLVTTGRVDELRSRVPRARPARIEGTFTAREHHSCRDELALTGTGRPRAQATSGSLS